jgi:DsbC/DsbD-like thiol-disulfide interchange protein
MLTDILMSTGQCRPFVIVRANGAATFAKLLLAIVLMVALVAPVAARAAESNRFISREDTVSIVSKSDTASGPTLRLGFLFRLSKGWHIYWKNAGDTGLPPQLTLTRPTNVTTSAFEWPAPDWLVVNKLGDYVVSGTVLLPFRVSLPQPMPAQGRRSPRRRALASVQCSHLRAAAGQLQIAPA